MKRVEQTESFDQVLLSYVDLCYSVALTMTRNPHDAHDLTRDVVIWAWCLRDTAEAQTGIKMKLLTALRARFLQRYQFPAFAIENRAAIAERI